MSILCKNSLGDCTVHFMIKIIALLVFAMITYINLYCLVRIVIRQTTAPLWKQKQASQDTLIRAGLDVLEKNTCGHETLPAAWVATCKSYRSF